MLQRSRFNLTGSIFAFSLGAGTEEPWARAASSENGAEFGLLTGHTATGGAWSAESHWSAGWQDFWSEHLETELG